MEGAVIYHGMSERDFSDLPHEVETACRNLRQYGDRFNTIIVQGVSGMCVGFPVALQLGKDIVVLRKEGEDCHDGFTLVGLIGIGDRVLFLDDFINTGDTRKRCRRAVEDESAKLVATYTYRDHHYKEVPQ